MDDFSPGNIKPKRISVGSSVDAPEACTEGAQGEGVTGFLSVSLKIA